MRPNTPAPTATHPESPTDLPTPRQPARRVPAQAVTTRLIVSLAGGAFGHSLRLTLAGLLLARSAGFGAFAIFTGGALAGSALGSATGALLLARTRARTVGVLALIACALAGAGATVAAATGVTAVAATLMGIAHGAWQAASAAGKASWPAVDRSSGLAKIGAATTAAWAAGGAAGGVLVTLPGPAVTGSFAAAAALGVLAAAVARKALSADRQAMGAVRVAPVAAKLRRPLITVGAIAVAASGPLMLSSGIISATVGPTWVAPASIATVAGATILPQVMRRLGDPLTIEVGILALCATALVGPWTLPPSVPLLIAATAVSSAGWNVLCVRGEALCAVRVHEHERGTAQALAMTVVAVAAAASATGFPLLAESVGTRDAILFAGAASATIAAAAQVTGFGIRARRRRYLAI